MTSRSATVAAIAPPEFARVRATSRVAGSLPRAAAASRNEDGARLSSSSTPGGVVLATTTSRRASSRRRVVLAPPPAATNPTDAWLAEVDADGRVPAGATRAPRRIVVFVEPSPFSHVSGMKNRFLRLIENLTELGDDVVVITPDRNPPAEYAGAEVIGLHGFALPFYPGNTLLLSYARDPRVEALFRTNPPDLIHCSSPGALIWTATGLAEKYKIPLVQSYHTHIPHYIPQYTGSTFLVKPMWDFIRLWTSKSDVTMVTSTILEDELKSEGCPRLEVWQKGVDTVAFNPKFRSEEMRARLRGGRKGGKIIGCVGRLGAEKNLYALKEILAKCPEGTNLAIVGDGPEKAKLEEHFAGTNAHFTGMITGDDLAAAYASLDVFVMPSESETLGFVVMEAMASGVPVVAVRAGGLQDILTNTPEVGQLYPSGDYDEAARLTTELLVDDAEMARQRRSCRDAVEEWGWMASNTKLRDLQYARAYRRHKRNERIRIFLDLVGARRRVAAVFEALMNAQWGLQLCAYVAAVVALRAARELVVAHGVGAALSGPAWVAAAQSVATASGPFGPAVMASAVAAASLIPFVPAAPMYAASGLMFGTAQGALISLVGALEAAAIAFAITRRKGVANVASYLATGAGFGAPARRFVRNQLKKIETFLEGDGGGEGFGTFAKLVAYRLVPHAPFTVANYLLGLTKVPATTFLASTLLGTAPWALFFALVGSAGNAFVKNGALWDAASAVASGADVALALTIGCVLAAPAVAKAATESNRAAMA